MTEHFAGLVQLLDVRLQIRIGFDVRLKDRLKRRVHRSIHILAQPFVEPCVGGVVAVAGGKRCVIIHDGASAESKPQGRCVCLPAGTEPA